MDGDIDIIAGNDGSPPQKNKWYENDGSESFTAYDLHSDTDSTHVIFPVDLDHDGDLDVLAGNYQQKDKWYRNTGGSAGYALTDTAPARMVNSAKDDFLKIEVHHNGIAGDNELELHNWNLLLEEADSDPLSSAEANALIANLSVYQDDGDGVWEDNGDDTIVTTIATLSLTDGAQTITFTDGDSKLQITPTNSKTYFVVVELTSDAESQTPNSFLVSFDPDADSVNEDRTEDTSVSVQDSLGITAGTEAIPEFNQFIVPIMAPIILLFYYRRKRRGGGLRE